MGEPVSVTELKLSVRAPLTTTAKLVHMVRISGYVVFSS